MGDASDTSEELSYRQARMVRAQEPQQRLDVLRAQCRFVVELAEAGIRRRHPDWSPQKIRRDAARRWLSPGDYDRWIARQPAVQG